MIRLRFFLLLLRKKIVKWLFVHGHNLAYTLAGLDEDLLRRFFFIVFPGVLKTDKLLSNDVQQIVFIYYFVTIYGKSRQKCAYGVALVVFYVPLVKHFGTKSPIVLMLNWIWCTNSYFLSHFFLLVSLKKTTYFNSRGKKEEVFFLIYYHVKSQTSYSFVWVNVINIYIFYPHFFAI